MVLCNVTWSTDKPFSILLPGKVTLLHVWVVAYMKIVCTRKRHTINAFEERLSKSVRHYPQLYDSLHWQTTKTLNFREEAVWCSQKAAFRILLSFGTGVNRFAFKHGRRMNHTILWWSICCWGIVDNPPLRPAWRIVFICNLTWCTGIPFSIVFIYPDCCQCMVTLLHAWVVVHRKIVCYLWQSWADLNLRQLETLEYLTGTISLQAHGRRQWSIVCMLTYLSGWLGASLKPTWVFGEPKACQTSPLGLQRVPLSVCGVCLACASSPHWRFHSKTLRRWQRTLISTHMLSCIHICHFAHKHTYYLAKTYPVKACSHSPSHTQQKQSSCLYVC